MSPGEVIQLAQAALLLVLTVVGPLLLTSLIVGTVIGLLQALTQIQEMTLVFVPKILAIFLVLLVALPFAGMAMASYMERIAARIVQS